MTENSFLRREADGAVFYTCAAFEPYPGLHHGFSTRLGWSGSFNLTFGRGGSREQVEANRRHFLAVLGLGEAGLATVSQIHSDRLLVFVDHELERSREGDALATRRTGIALAVQVADCFPILLADTASGGIAAVHSGWRGTASRILRKTIAGMETEFGTDPRSLIVAVGPGIRSCCMEVGPEVAARFDQEYPRAGLLRQRRGCDGKYFLDLPAALALQCAEGGVPRGQVFDIELCTRCRTDEFFSYRAEGQASGRMMAIIGRS